jgi:hypothetical protein
MALPFVLPENWKVICLNVWKILTKVCVVVVLIVPVVNVFVQVTPVAVTVEDAVAWDVVAEVTPVVVELEVTTPVLVALEVVELLDELCAVDADVALV